MEGAVFRVRFGAYILGKNWISEKGSEMCSLFMRILCESGGEGGFF